MKNLKMIFTLFSCYLSNKYKNRYLAFKNAYEIINNNEIDLDIDLP